MEYGEQSRYSMDFVTAIASLQSLTEQTVRSSLNPLLRGLCGESFPQGLLFPNVT